MGKNDSDDPDNPDSPSSISSFSCNNSPSSANSKSSSSDDDCNPDPHPSSSMDITPKIVTRLAKRLQQEDPKPKRALPSKKTKPRAAAPVPCKEITLQAPASPDHVADCGRAAATNEAADQAPAQDTSDSQAVNTPTLPTSGTTSPSGNNPLETEPATQRAVAEDGWTTVSKKNKFSCYPAPTIPSDATLPLESRPTCYDCYRPTIAVSHKA
ncbi:putative uncharacterized protein DDB_G0290521, partial [Hetaerina americana]|uniref:putative uncharacterized protein DDB_G0290521 n=1 Tax=Hetaerina americana TaxID=62018 RepID=UPI003A7F2425